MDSGKLTRVVMVFNILTGLCLIVVMAFFLAVLKGWLGNDLGREGSAVNQNVIDYLNSSPVYAGDEGSYTARYLENNSLSSLSDGTEGVNTFVEQNIGVAYAPAKASEIKASGERGKEAMKKYLDAVTVREGSAMQAMSADETEAAYRKFLNEDDPADLDRIIESVRHNEGVLREVAVPVEAIGLHAKLLGAMTALEENLLLMRNIEQDYVGGVLGARKVEDLVEVFREISLEMRDLEERFGV